MANALAEIMEIIKRLKARIRNLESLEGGEAHDLAGARHNPDTLADLNAKVSDATLDDQSGTRDPNAHKTSHQNGGSDEISVEGLSGDLVDAQDAKTHASDHVGAADEVDGDKLDVDWDPSNYTPDSSIAEASDADDLSAHLKGIDDGLAGGLTYTELAGGEDHLPTNEDQWEDWDLSSIVGSGAKVVEIAVGCLSTYKEEAGIRKNGSTLDRKRNINAAADTSYDWGLCLLTECDANRVIEIYGSSNYTIFQVVGYWS